MTNGAFLGRFQPFHLGHLSAIKQALKGGGHLLIGIGSSDANYRPANPFTCSERIQMLQAALDEAKIPRDKYSLIAVPNIQNYALWAQHVELYLPPFQKLYTGSPTVTRLFEDYNAKLKHPYTIISVKKELKISSTLVRAAILKNKGWEKLLPNSVTKLIKSWNGIKRLKDVQEAEK